MLQETESRRQRDLEQRVKEAQASAASKQRRAQLVHQQIEATAAARSRRLLAADRVATAEHAVKQAQLSARLTVRRAGSLIAAGDIRYSIYRCYLRARAT